MTVWLKWRNLLDTMITDTWPNKSKPLHMHPMDQILFPRQE